MGNEGRRGAGELQEILEVVSKKLPGFLASMRKLLYSQEAGKSFGEAAGSFYKELKEAGMSNEEAFELTRDYLAALKNIGTGKNINFMAGEKEEETKETEQEG